MALKLNNATYNPAGYMTLAWDAANVAGSTGFMVHIANTLTGGYRDYSVLDPRATSVIMPYDGTFDVLQATLYILDASYKTGDRSNTVVVSLKATVGAGPVDPMPTSPLSIGGASSITFDAQSLLGTASKSIDWMAAPGADATADHGAAPVTDGSATFRVNVTQKPNEEITSLLTLSVWDAEQPNAGHAALLYNIVRPNLTVSQSRSYGVACVPEFYPFDIKKKDQIIALTALVRDADDGTPVRNYQLGWKSTSGVAPIVRYPNGTTPPATPDGVYTTYTDANGNVTLFFASPRPSIGEMGIYWINGINVRPYMMAFTSMGQDWESPEMEAPDVPTPLHLDHYADDQGVPVYLVNDRETWMKRGAFVAYWINGVMLDPERLDDDFLSKPKMIPKQYFKTNGENFLGVCIADAAGSNGHDSRLTDFFADGKVPVEQPHKPSGVFNAPSLNNTDLVNAALIAGGLRVKVPPSAKLNLGDAVTMILYLDGYFPGTSDQKTGTIHMADSRVVQGNDIGDGFFLVASEDLLVGYAANLKGVTGSMQAQYKVVSKGIESYSAVGKFRLATV